MALVGLYLRIEHQWTGRSIQMAHMRLARAKREWPAFVLPFGRGAMREEEVLAAEDREAAIDAWAGEVWAAYAESNRATVDALVLVPATFALISTLGRRRRGGSPSVDAAARLARAFLLGGEQHE